MWSWILGVVGALVALMAGAVLALVVVLRTGWAPGVRFVRRFNRRFTNPRVLRTAGQPGESALIRHRGRSSGREYATPIDVEPVAGGFLVTLPYGPGADWVRNVLAAGGAELAVDGGTHPVSGPRLLRFAEAGPQLSAGERRLARIFAVDDFLLLHVAHPGD